MYIPSWAKALGFNEGEVTMQTVHVLEKTGTDGVLHLRISLGVAQAEYEVLVVVQPRTAGNARKPEDLGWPPGFFEQTAGSITDETFERPPQGAAEERLGFE
jgi:hypothetical protein